jgi:glycosyltransferase involved in cell wall biosynthesis
MECGPHKASAGRFPIKRIFEQCAVRGASTKAELVPVCPRSFRLGKPRPDPMAAQTALLEAVAQRADQFDVIHAHIDWLHLPIVLRAGIPFLTTLHGRLDPSLSLPPLECCFGTSPIQAEKSRPDGRQCPLQPPNLCGRISTLRYFGVVGGPAQCPLWVMSRHSHRKRSCPLYPRSRHSLARFAINGASNAPAQKLPKRTSRQAPPRTKQVARCREDPSRC